MTISKSNREALLRQLTRFAGDAAIVEAALIALSDREKPPTLDEVLDKIIEIQKAQKAQAAAREEESLLAVN